MLYACAQYAKFEVGGSQSGRSAAKFSLASWLSLAHCAAERATMDLRSGHTVLEEDYDETYEPTEEGEAG